MSWSPPATTSWPNGPTGSTSRCRPRRSIRAPDRGRLLDECLKYAAGHRVDGALTFSDDLLVDTARFAAERGLPGQPVATIEAFRDKFVQRSVLAGAGLPGPRFARIAGPDDVPAALAAVGLPAVLKPTRGSGSALVSIVETQGRARRRRP